MKLLNLLDILASDLPGEDVTDLWLMLGGVLGIVVGVAWLCSAVAIDKAISVKAWDKEF